ncbi:MAG: ATP-binding protein [Phormidesmis sp.]
MESNALTTQPSPSATLLIIDDSAEDRAAFRRYLTDTNEQPYQILESASAEEGLTCLGQHHVDLILLDYGLPGINGLEFLQHLQNQSAEQAAGQDSEQAPERAITTLPLVLMLTGQGDERIAAQTIKAGAQDYIVKQQRMDSVLKLAVRTALREAALQAQVRDYQAQQALVQDVVLRIRQSLDVRTILTEASLEVRKLLACDRVILYRFLPNGMGIVEVESVIPPWKAMRGEVIADSCFKNGWIDQFLTGKTTAIENIHTSTLAPYHIKLLSRFQVQANLVVPIVMSTPFVGDFHQPDTNERSQETAPKTSDEAKDKTDLARTDSRPISTEPVAGDRSEPDPFQVNNKTLWGLLIAHQCTAPRQWKTQEIQLLQQLCNQLAIALQQSALYEQLKLANQKLEHQVEARTAQLQQANQQLLEVNQSLQASNRDLEQFAYIASHDLREPLRKIKSFAELLAKRYQGELDETGDRYINYVTNGAVRMQRLINDLLAYSRLGRTELTRVKTDLNQSLDQAIDTLNDRIVQKQAVIQAEPLPNLAVDALQIEQLFFNLIENALKYSSDDLPKIKINAVQSEAEWTFFVQDNGIGIAPEFYERIFTIFQRLHSKSEYSGTGIGLAICQKIIERHGGKIGLKSIPGEGTTFWFTLPAQ